MCRAICLRECAWLGPQRVIRERAAGIILLRRDCSRVRGGVMCIRHCKLLEEFRYGREKLDLEYTDFCTDGMRFWVIARSGSMELLRESIRCVNSLIQMNNLDHVQKLRAGVINPDVCF